MTWVWKILQVHMNVRLYWVLDGETHIKMYRSLISGDPFSRHYFPTTPWKVDSGVHSDVCSGSQKKKTLQFLGAFFVQKFPTLTKIPFVIFFYTYHHISVKQDYTKEASTGRKNSPTALSLVPPPPLCSYNYGIIPLSM